MDIQETIAWLKTSVTGIILLGTAGSLLAVLILKLFRGPKRGKSDDKFPHIQKVASHIVTQYQQSLGPDRHDTNKAVRRLFLETKRDQFSNRIVAEYDLTEFGPAQLPTQTRKRGFPAHEALSIAQRASTSWKKSCNLIMVTSGTHDYGYSQTQGIFIRVYRWLFLFRDASSQFLLVTIDPGPLGPVVSSMHEWSIQETDSKDLPPFREWITDAVDAAEKARTNGILPKNTGFTLRVWDVLGKKITAWNIVSQCGVYLFSSNDSNMVLDACLESKKACAHFFKYPEGKERETMTLQLNHSKEFNIKAMPIDDYDDWQYKVEKDFHNGQELAHVFPTRTTYFYYDDPISEYFGIPSRAQSILSAPQRIVADAQLVEISNTSVKIHERHYGEHGKQIYEGAISIDPVTGRRLNRTASNGSYDKAYFYFWPNAR